MDASQFDSWGRSSPYDDDHDEWREETMQQLQEEEEERKRRRKRRRVLCLMCIGMIAVTAAICIPLLVMPPRPKNETPGAAQDDGGSACTPSCDEDIHYCVGTAAGHMSSMEFSSCIVSTSHHSRRGLVALGSCMSKCNPTTCTLNGTLTTLHHLQCWEDCAFAAADVNCSDVPNRKLGKQASTVLFTGESYTPGPTTSTETPATVASTSSTSSTSTFTSSSTSTSTEPTSTMTTATTTTTPSTVDHGAANDTGSHGDADDKYNNSNDNDDNDDSNSSYNNDCDDNDSNSSNNNDNGDNDSNNNDDHSNNNDNGDNDSNNNNDGNDSSNNDNGDNDNTNDDNDSNTESS
ncbi:hypothetical protein PTSG_08505 [Salpingoeca rosetta]|uniref:Uncharacterized protein n=1 Tax=Salpingoeca rosetta (strain ATCC 50818 / BSB-021) TaxID=946362 RepID=F2UJW0_SALR5|nr:uncharacterized protein PTSG_08505 [Salpingoeca rosetta]EGD77409.1 hypothetical protein PTSG_08505 [Salpingoeca rosetta]|eukprot:XP_004990753.1 hypothetical protein PTSG_08505 [Salpingoeca rosetta]